MSFVFGSMEYRLPQSGADFFGGQNSRRVYVTIYSRHVCVIFEISRHNAKISKFSKLCHILNHKEVSKKRFRISVL